MECYPPPFLIVDTIRLYSYFFFCILSISELNISGIWINSLLFNSTFSENSYNACDMAFTKIPTSLQDCFLIEPQIFWDARWLFMETYSTVEFEKIGIPAHFVQDNHTKSKKGVLRWLHFQTRKPQAKLVRVISGSVYDVVVDLRQNSPTFGKWEGFLLSEENKKMLFVPRGFAHGFLTLEDNTEFLYKCDDIYDPWYESGILWDDPTLAIDWQTYIDQYMIGELEISQKDKRNVTFHELQKEDIFHNIYLKRWHEWIRLKKNIHDDQKSPTIKEWQLWWCYFWENIGSEMNGKWEKFSRPVIIYKKLSKHQFLAIPTTTRSHQWSWYVSFLHQNKQMFACLHQSRIIDVRRLDNSMGQLDDVDRSKIKHAFTKLYT